MEQLSFDFDNLTKETDTENIGDETSINKNDLFDCCSRYRECSDTKKCVISDKTYSKYCLYRDKLKTGDIIYGKNAKGFDINVYNQFLETYNALDKTEIIFLNSIVHTLLSDYRDSIWMESSDLLEALDRKGLIRAVINDELLEDFDFNYIKRILKSNNLLENYAKCYPDDKKITRYKKHLLEYIKNNKIAEVDDNYNNNELYKILKDNNCLEDYAKCYPEDQKISYKKEHVLEYIRNNKFPEIYDKCINKYRDVSIKVDMYKYYIELYLDYILTSSNYTNIKFSKYDIEGMKKEKKKEKTKTDTKKAKKRTSRSNDEMYVTYMGMPMLKSHYEKYYNSGK